ncbi:MAG: NmrA family NAD(P)-binding protein [Gemmatimonadetes bacterium]|nr:NmrA family NAD(P)-binding protein [Gemmatimonadota bacterium]
MPAATSPPILVAGASGQLGGTVARLLLAEGFPVRALARRREPLRPLADLGAEIVAGDLRDAGAVRQACAGRGRWSRLPTTCRGAARPVPPGSTSRRTDRWHAPRATRGFRAGCMCRRAGSRPTAWSTTSA